jgi:hypothetical protein
LLPYVSCCWWHPTMASVSFIPNWSD